MGTEIPYVKYDAKQNDLTYSFSTTYESIDIVREAFRDVKELTIKLSMVENAAYRLATNIKKTQKLEKYNYPDVQQPRIYDNKCP